MIEANGIEVKVVDESEPVIVISGDSEGISLQQDGDHVYIPKRCLEKVIRAMRKTSRDT